MTVDVNVEKSDRPLHPARAARIRLLGAVVLGVLSVIGSVLLIVIDGVSTSVSWVHHAGVSAAPLLLVAGALIALTLANPPHGRAMVLRIVTAAAFASWGLSQLFPNEGVGTVLGDIAILLFVIDAAVFATVEAVGLLRPAADERHGAAVEGEAGQSQSFAP